MASKLIVKTCKANQIISHPNADRLDIATVDGWQCVIQKGTITKDDVCVYIPIDAMLPEKLFDHFFPQTAKVRPKTNRIKTIKLRGFISQGLLVKVSELDMLGYNINRKVGIDVKDILEITKFEPKEKCPYTVKHSEEKKKVEKHENFMEYTGIEHFNNFHKLINPEEEVVITEKIHGANYRCGYVKPQKTLKSVFNNFIKYFKSFIVGKDTTFSGYDFVFGSHNVELKDLQKRGNVYAEITRRYNFKKLLDPGVVIYGEVYGKNIQKNYDYGLKDDIDLVVFDVMKDGEYLDYDQALSYCMIKGLKTPPLLYRGALKDIDLPSVVSGESVMCPKQKVREGVVIKPLYERNYGIQRVILKYLNPNYLLLKGNSDWH